MLNIITVPSHAGLYSNLYIHYVGHKQSSTVIIISTVPSHTGLYSNLYIHYVHVGHKQSSTVALKVIITSDNR